MSFEPIQTFDVEVLVTARVVAKNAQDAVHKVCDYLREGIGTDDGSRMYSTSLAHGKATSKSVFIPERRPSP